MAVQRKRKHATLDEIPSKQIQPGIKDFGNVGKPSNAFDSTMKKRKIIHKRDQTPPPTSKASVEKTDKKRKRTLEAVEEESADESSVFGKAKENPVLKQLVQDTTGTPRSKRSKTQQPLSPVETPSKDTSELFNKMRLSRSTKPIPFTFGSKEQPYDTPPDTPPANTYEADHLPVELEDLVNLHSAFLAALSLYYAHNGTSTPVNVKGLLPMITKNWKKRSVAVDDLRMLLGIPQIETQFILQDFGKAGICLTKSEPRGRAVKRSASFVDEMNLSTQFEEALQVRWRDWLQSTARENHDVAVFMDQLPQAEITQHPSVQQTSTLFGRGRERLADLKASQAAANPITVKSNIATPPPQRTEQVVQNRGASLLDRILAKQAHAQSLPEGPTRAQLEKKAALHRIEDIERVLDLLTAGRPRCSFSMPVMAQHLQQSLRNPISKEEIERCLDLMASEITPGFVRLVRSGTVTGVVVTKAGKVDLEQLRQRVQSAGA